MVDVIAVAMVFVLMALGWSLVSVKYRKRYQQHKMIQLSLAVALFILLVLFEFDLQFLENWRARAEMSPYYDAATETGLVIYSLWMHVFFATTTLALWLTIILKALRRFPNPPHPNGHSTYHTRWGTLAAIDMVLTAASGWAFYFLAFIA
jgi:hypothetical protein